MIKCAYILTLVNTKCIQQNMIHLAFGTKLIIIFKIEKKNKYHKPS